MALNTHTDREWEKFGATSPYFGVLTMDKFKGVELTDALKDDFFATGSAYVDGVLERAKFLFDLRFPVRRALDFGCGVGRLVIPLARVADEVTGVDVSESMLAEARRNCASRGAANVRLLKGDDCLSGLSDRYDLVLSYIVFQHIPVSRGMAIFTSLLSRLESGGIAILHFTYAKDDSVRRWVQHLKRYVPFTANFIALLKGEGFFSPQMEMNAYNLNRLFLAIQSSGVSSCFADFTDHGGQLGVIIYFRKATASM